MCLTSAPIMLCSGVSAAKMEREFPDFRWIALNFSAPPKAAVAALLPDALGCVCADGLAPFRDWWMAHIDFPHPGVFVDVNLDDLSDMRSWLMQVLVEDRAEMAAQFSGLSAQIGYLRQTSREQGEELAHLRQQADGQKKRLLFKIAGHVKLKQFSDTIVSQLLPGEAVGLAGLILQLRHGGTGRLVVRLIVTEDQAEMAVWQIDNPVAGALRLSLHEPLRLLRRTAQVQLEWQGESTLEWSARAMDDTLYCAQIDGTALPVCLAMRGKNCGFGNGIAPRAPLRSMLVAPGALASAKASQQAFVKWMDMEQALMVHPRPGAISSAFLADTLPPNLARIQVDLETLHVRASPISYAIGVAPHDATRGEDGLPEFLPGCRSDWVTIAPRDRHTLMLTQLMADTPQDLWLMTRLPEGKQDSSWGWATFLGLRLWA